MAYLADWVLETASNPGTNATVNLAGAVIGPFKSFASSFANGDRVFYTISDETAARETGVGTFTAGAPNSISRDTVTANTLGTTSRLNFIGAVFVWCSPPASRAAYFDANSNLSALGSITLNNNASIVMKDSTGVSHNAMRMNSGNAIVLESGSAGLGIVNQAETATIWSISNLGLTNQVGTIWSITTNASGAAFTNSQTSNTPSIGWISNLINSGSFHSSFQSNGVGVGTISPVSTTGVAYNTTSDQTLIPAEDSGSIIDRLKPRWFRWKSAPDEHSEPGFFAQEVQRIYSWAVTKGRGRKSAKDYMPWQMDQAKLMPVVVAELKALRARVAELEKQNSGTEFWKGV